MTTDELESLLEDARNEIGELKYELSIANHHICRLEDEVDMLRVLLD